MTKIELGTVSHGTLRTEDLLETFADLLERFVSAPECFEPTSAMVEGWRENMARLGFDVRSFAWAADALDMERFWMDRLGFDVRSFAWAADALDTPRARVGDISPEFYAYCQRTMADAIEQGGTNLCRALRQTGGRT